MLPDTHQHKGTPGSGKQVEAKDIDRLRLYVQRIARTIVSTATYTARVVDYYLGVTRTTVGACAITLPLITAINVQPTELFNLIVLDEGGNAAVNNITISAAAGNTINGAASVTINTNYGSKWLATGGGTQWFVIT